MSATFSTTITPKPATGNGDISGFKVTCTCGFTFTNSLALSAQMEAAEHLAWHEKQAKKGKKGKKVAK